MFNRFCFSLFSTLEGYWGPRFLLTLTSGMLIDPSQALDHWGRSREKGAVSDLFLSRIPLVAIVKIFKESRD